MRKTRQESGEATLTAEIGADSPSEESHPPIPWRGVRPDAQAFDEIRIVTTPRYKTSGLSGDEWRISARADFYRNGGIVFTSASYRNVEIVCNFMGALHATAIDDGFAYFAGIDGVCDQEGCPEPSTVTYRLRQRFTREGIPYPEDRMTRPIHREFCNTHKRRGDCGLEDADHNYDLVPGPKPKQREGS